MCRIFGFRSVLLSKVHSSLVSAENALMGQSKRHPDGWGLAYYVAESPHVVKSTNTAESDELFQHLSGIVTSQTVLAHIRKATHGKLTVLNTHPFQYGKWTFAHNGNVKDFLYKRNKILEKTSKDISPYCLGDTDSELIFYYFLSYLQKGIDLHAINPDVKIMMTLLSEALTDLTNIIGPLTIKDTGIPTENYLTFVISNGHVMLAFNGGLTLYYSTHKKRCPERDTCSSFAPSCETKAQEDSKINHLIVSSEPLQGENVWYKIQPGTIVGVDHQMKLHSSNISLPFQTAKEMEEV
jgi:predicted glutamine amidotransferase